MWLLYLILAVVIYIGGYVTAFFMLRNNPSYLRIDKMGKEELSTLMEKIRARL